MISRQWRTQLRCGFLSLDLERCGTNQDYVTCRRVRGVKKSSEGPPLRTKDSEAAFVASATALVTATAASVTVCCTFSSVVILTV